MDAQSDDMPALDRELQPPSHGIVLREGPKPTRVRGRIPRIARLLALAHHFQELLDTGVVRTQMELAELTKLTTARITQIMNLLILAPDIQEEILFMPPMISGDPPVTEKTLRPVLQTWCGVSNGIDGLPFVSS